MEINVAQQTGAFLQACLLGFLIGVLYDCFRILRIAFKTPSVFIMVQDIIFFLICSALTFFYILSVNDGELRIFIVAGQLLGAILQHLTIGVIIIKLSRAIISLIIAVRNFIFKIFIRPPLRLIFWIISRIFIKPAKKISISIKKITNKTKFRLKQWRLLLYNLRREKSKRENTHA